ncbi:mRNA cleavage and polyadenylation specificity factor complex subunit pta1 [Podospora australis]|uniref:mRNA cleavage and polyadenylation specificity factor complex subunit pta1 n=1 Tax=Podospora australis TaxID=1536484 RepID=A0AAN7ANR8_9PEZI|nr:mRNA cleavage and polyadenylation specificity factor complex subunit pta1 [Podospora australis]
MASSSSPLSVKEQLQQLQLARKLTLENKEYYDRIVKGVLPVIGPSGPLELRRWGAEFLAESLATPVLNMREKENMTLAVLETLSSLLESEQNDTIVLKATIAAAASAYPIVFRWIVNNSYHTEAWEQMSKIKARILQLWDGALPPVKLSCIKFVQRVVLAQTASNGMEAKYLGLDISLNMVPPNHPLLDSRHMEAEATGLLDRMLGVLQDHSNDALLVDATLNCLSILIRSRPSTTNRIINSVLNFNPLKLANSPMTPKNKVLIKSMEKTTRMLMIHILKRDPNNQHAGKIQQYIERIVRSRADIFDEAGRNKRALADQAQYENAKRQKLESAAAAAASAAAVAPPSPQVVIPPLALGPHTLAAVFTLTQNAGLQAFNAKQIQNDLAAKIVVKALTSLDPAVLDMAVNGIRTRFAALHAAAAAAAAVAPPVPVQQSTVINPSTALLGVEEEDDDDDYEPNFNAAEDTEQILNKLDNAPPEEPADQLMMDSNTSLGLGHFELPPPPLIDPDTATKVGQVVASRVFATLGGLAENTRKPKAGINRLAASSYDRESWMTVVTRLATRSTAGLSGDGIKPEENSNALDRSRNMPLSDVYREMLYAYILEDWRRRIEVAVAWLCEEWYNDQLTKRMNGNSEVGLNYERCALRLVDGVLAYITPQDKVLTRFLAEIPELSRTLLGRLKTLCGDPTTVQLALQTLLYQVMMRPPVREIALDTVASIWMEYEDARPLAAKYLVKWRPGFIEAQQAAAAQAAAQAGGNGNGITA